MKSIQGSKKVERNPPIFFLRQNNDTDRTSTQRYIKRQSGLGCLYKLCHTKRRTYTLEGKFKYRIHVEIKKKQNGGRLLQKCLCILKRARSYQ